MLGCEFTRFLMCFHAVVFGEKTETRCVSVFSQVDSDKSDTRQRGINVVYPERT